MNTLEKILKEMKEIKDRNRKENLYAKYPVENNKQEHLNIYSQGYEDGTDNFYNGLKSFICSHMDEVARLQNKVVIDILNGLSDWWYSEAPVEEGEEKSETLKILEQVQGFVETFLDEDVPENTPGKWIPVSERLPEDTDEQVLVTVNGGYKGIMFHHAIMLGDYSNRDKDWVVEGWEEWKNPNVTAWQPLPEAYREEPCS